MYSREVTAADVLRKKAIYVHSSGDTFARFSEVELRALADLVEYSLVRPLHTADPLWICRFCNMRETRGHLTGCPLAAVERVFAKEQGNG